MPRRVPGELVVPVGGHHVLEDRAGVRVAPGLEVDVRQEQPRRLRGGGEGKGESGTLLRRGKVPGARAPPGRGELDGGVRRVAPERQLVVVDPPPRRLPISSDSMARDRRARVLSGASFRLWTYRSWAVAGCPVSDIRLRQAKPGLQLIRLARQHAVEQRAGRRHVSPRPMRIRPSRTARSGLSLIERPRLGQNPVEPRRIPPAWRNDSASPTMGSRYDGLRESASLYFSTASS